MFSAGPAGSAGAAAVGPETITEAVFQSGAVFIPNPYQKSLWIHARNTYHHFAQILLSMGVSSGHENSNGSHVCSRASYHWISGIRGQDLRIRGTPVWTTVCLCCIYRVIKPDPMAIIMSMSILIVILLCGREWVKSPGGYPELQRRRDLASEENEKILLCYCS